MLPSIEKEVKKLLQAKINVSLRYADWVENLLLVRKKNGEIRLCIYFRNMNRASLKDNYSLPMMDQIMQKVVVSLMISIIYGFSKYNQIVVHLDDKN